MPAAALESEAGGSIRPHFRPFTPKAAEAAQRLVERFGADLARRPSVVALKALSERIRQAGYEWDDLAPADRLNAVWVLWEGATPAAEQGDFLAGFLDWIAADRRRVQAGRLALSWAAGFEPSLQSIRIAGAWLACNAAWLPPPWPSLTQEFPLFSPEAGPQALARAYLLDEGDAAGFFAHRGLPAEALTGGLGLAVLDAAVVIAGRVPSQTPEGALRLCPLAEAGALFAAPGQGRSTARVRAVRLALAETLLLSSPGQNSPPAVTAQLTDFLLRHYGDLRISPEGWAGVRSEAVAVMRRRLTEDSVRSYFRRVAMAKSAERQRAAERAAFWLPRLEAIEDAWLLLASPNPAAPQGRGRLAHGRLGGARPDAAALLLRIGGMTVLERADGDSELVWLSGNAFAPPLYRAKEPYWPGMLTKAPDFSSAHGREEGGTWQERLAAFLGREETRRRAV